MQGSLEQPPIIVRESWLSWGGTMLLGVLVAGFSLAALFDGEVSVPGLSWFGAVAGCAFTAWRFFRRARIEIWPDRFAWMGMLPIRREYAFADIDDFAVRYLGKGGYVVAFNLVSDSPRRTTLDKLDEVLSGFDGTIGGSWEIPHDQLADLLNRTRLLPSAWR